MRFGVSKEKEAALERRLAELGIEESDLVEKFVRSSGPGGQNVNKLNTCVFLRHEPSGIEVKMQEERSQAMNRYRARQVLADKFEAEILKRKTEEMQRIARIRKQKRRRSRRAKEKMLEEKHRRAEKKDRRRKPEAEEQ
jgi:protein subunit release factor B